MFHLVRVYKKHTGVSLHGYRQRLRLAYALRCLQMGERDLAGLAVAVGYSSQSHMSNIFQSELGVISARAMQALSP